MKTEVQTLANEAATLVAFTHAMGEIDVRDQLLNALEFLVEEEGADPDETLEVMSLQVDMLNAMTAEERARYIGRETLRMNS